MSYKIVYYVSILHDNPIKNYLDSISVKQQVKILRVLRYIQEFGPSAVSNHIRKLTGTPLWEIRILGKDNMRLIYIIVIRNTVLLLHGFTKKSDKTPKNELDLALQRYRDWRKRHGQD